MLDPNHDTYWVRAPFEQGDLWRLHPNFHFRNIAIHEAEESFKVGEHPIGAVLVYGGNLIAQSGNRCHLDNSPLKHVEQVILGRGIDALGMKYLTGCVLYVTHQPCPHCLWAMILARISVLVWGTSIRDVEQMLVIPNDFRLQTYDIEKEMEKADYRFSYYPRWYARECKHLLELCAHQALLPFIELLE